MEIKRVVRRFFDRRNHTEPVPVDRRQGRATKEDAAKKLEESFARFNHAIQQRTRQVKSVMINDRQQVVIFSTFQETCRSTGPVIGSVRLCRHPQHPDAANTELVICDEEKCPYITAALSAA